MLSNHPVPAFLQSVIIIAIFAGCTGSSDDSIVVTGELRQWHKVTVNVIGPAASESGSPNPFLDYRLDVTFSKDENRYKIPGYYSADGVARESGSSSGPVWRAHFSPPEAGRWNFEISFREGDEIALNNSEGLPLPADSATGFFIAGPSDKAGRDHRAKGRLQYTGERYLQFAGTGDYFIKGGADSPENLLAFADFDNTERGKNILHRFEPHVADWNAGDPTWHGDKGKGLIGALNYLAGKGMNSVYFLTNNLTGDGDDVFPYTNKDERFRFDTSKLDQWEIVFQHMDSLGIILHVVTQETENDQLLDGGELGPERKLYYRELVARFGHHLAITWNLGEENTNTDEQRKAFASYLRDLDPYDHPIVIHTYPNQYDQVYSPLLGFGDLNGPSLQMADMTKTHAETIKWINESEAAGQTWFVSLDEIGPHTTGVTPDGPDNNHDAVRRHALWGHLMAGGAGVEWYFGYQYPHSDLTAEDWRSRDNFWDQTRYALDFFKEIPFWEMQSADELADHSEVFVFAKPGEVYAVYLPEGVVSTRLEVGEVSGELQWYNPRTGEFEGEITEFVGDGSILLNAPEASGDWVALVR